MRIISERGWRMEIGLNTLIWRVLVLFVQLREDRYQKSEVRSKGSQLFIKKEEGFFIRTKHFAYFSVQSSEFIELLFCDIFVVASKIK